MVTLSVVLPVCMCLYSAHLFWSGNTALWSQSILRASFLAPVLCAPYFLVSSPIRNRRRETKYRETVPLRSFIWLHCQGNRIGQPDIKLLVSISLWHQVRIFTICQLGKNYKMQSVLSQNFWGKYCAISQDAEQACANCRSSCDLRREASMWLAALL